MVVVSSLSADFKTIIFGFSVLNLVCANLQLDWANFLFLEGRGVGVVTGMFSYFGFSVPKLVSVPMFSLIGLCFQF